MWGKKCKVENGPPKRKIWPNVPNTLPQPMCHVFVTPYIHALTYRYIELFIG